MTDIRTGETKAIVGGGGKFFVFVEVQGDRAIRVGLLDRYS